MKKVCLFLKEHIPLLIFQLFLVLFILLLYYLDGFRGWDTAIYSIIMSMVLTVGYLLAKYILRRSFYATIVRKPRSMEDALIRHVQTPEQQQVVAYMRQLYKLYQNEVQSLYAAQHRQLQFVNQWVHQMKTPLSVIGLLLQEEEALDKQSIAEEVEKLKRGLEIVLVNARLETFEEDMQIEQVQLKLLIQEVVNDYKKLFIANHVFPVISMDESLYVATDVKWLKTVIGQFITNAVKYTFEDGKKIYFEAMRHGSGIKLFIRDEGIGIPASDLKRVTKAFFTGENGRLTGESTGMGLFIASEVCMRLGHRLQIQSEQGKGTTIQLEFKSGEVSEGDE